MIVPCGLQHPNREVEIPVHSSLLTWYTKYTMLPTDV